MTLVDEAFVHPAKVQTLPPGHALYQMAMGYFVPCALAFVAQLGIADLLKDGPRSAGDLAAATQTHAPSLARVMRLLTSVGVFAELPDGTFTLTPLGETLRADVPNSVRACHEGVRSPPMTLSQVET